MAHGAPPATNLRDRERKRSAPGFAVVLVLGSLIAAALRFGWFETWSLLTPAMHPPLADSALTFLAAPEAVRRGLDPMVHTAHGVMNYPRVWQYLAIALHLSPSQSVPFAVIALFIPLLASLFFLARITGSWLILPFACSGAVLMGIERGNTDLLIFSLVFAASIRLSRPLVSNSLFILGTVLKLFPIVPQALLLVVRSRLIQAVGVAISAAYLIAIRAQLPLIRSANSTSAGCAWSFGGAGCLAVLDSSFFARHDLSPGVALLLLKSAAVLASLALVHRFRPALDILGAAQESAREPADGGFMLLVGSSIFLAAFATGANWDYRLIFLLLALPALARSPALAAKLTLALIFSSMNEGLIHLLLGKWGTALNTGCKWALFVLLLGVAITAAARLRREDQMQRRALV